MQQDQLDSDRQNLERQNELSKKQALSYIKVQIALTAATALLYFYDNVVAYSALTGGLIATTANAWFTYKVFRVGPASAAQAMLASVYVGEAYKIVLTSALFICAFLLIKPINAFALLISYFFIHISPIVVNLSGKRTGNSE